MRQHLGIGFGDTEIIANPGCYTLGVASQQANALALILKRKDCVFCRGEIKGIDYKDTNLLRKFISDRGKIRARRITGVSVQEQRLIARAVKNAREMALMPYAGAGR